MVFSDFSPEDMQLVMLANARVICEMKLTHSDEHMRIKERISSLIIKCAEGGERDLQKLVDCAHDGLRDDRAT